MRLTPTEYELLFELSVHAGRVLTHDQLLQRVWGPERTDEPWLVREVVKRLRSKLGDDAGNPAYILTAPRVGYRMTKGETLGQEEQITDREEGINRLTFKGGDIAMGSRDQLDIAQQVHRRMRSELPDMPLIARISDARTKVEETGKKINLLVDVMSKRRAFPGTCEVCNTWPRSVET